MREPHGLHGQPEHTYGVKRFNSALNGVLADAEVKQKLPRELFPTTLEQAKNEVAESSAYRQRVAMK